ncbi:MAG: TatD family hydrolase [Firmicutes bacterium]|nr:TatD family hydrolase [Bacillota bacterium]
MIKIVDSHAHYENKRFSKDRDELLNAMPGYGVDMIINIGSDLPTSKASINLAENFSHVYATVGVHPHESKTLTFAHLEELRRLCSHEKVVAVGEIGLDFFYEYSPQLVQRHWFKQQLKLAREVGLPVVIHSREADKVVFDIIAESSVRKGVIHCFPGDADLAKVYVDMGFYIGVGGVVTYDETGLLQSAVDATPLERILLETDAPYLSPAPFRNMRNESQYLVHVAEEIAKIKGVSVETVYKQTSENARNLFFERSSSIE